MPKITSVLLIVAFVCGQSLAWAFLQDAGNQTPGTGGGHDTITTKKDKEGKKDTPGSGGGADTLTMKGLISSDGTIFTRDSDQTSWSIANIAAVKAYAGQTVAVKAEVDQEKKEIRVLSVKIVSASNKSRKDQKDPKEEKQ